MIKKSVENVRISSNLAKNTKREITKTEPIVSSASKPLITWLTSAVTCIIVLMMSGLGFSNTENYPQWILPKEAKMRLGKGAIRNIQFSPDGTQLAVGSSMGVWIYDVQTGNEISLLPSMLGEVTYSPDGRFIAACGEDPLSSLGGTSLEKGVVLWHIAKRSEIPVNETLPAASIIRFSNDNKTLIFLSMSRDTIYRVDVETGETTTTKMDERPGRIHLEKYALTEDKIAIGSDNGKIQLWDTNTGTR